jgi:hypothetical protein
MYSIKICREKEPRPKSILTALLEPTVLVMVINPQLNC